MSFLRLILAFHNHQPIGNFDGTIEQAYNDSYLPFIQMFSRYDSLKLCLHTSGSLMVWLADHHPEYLDMIGELAADGRIEVIGGPFYEPILAMLPSRDIVGQIRKYSSYLNKRFGIPVRGMWMPERIWEPSFVQDLAEAGMEYTIVDDYHFKKAGLIEDQLYGYYLSEDDGRLMKIFPGSEKLRYYIPFQHPQTTIDYCRHIYESNPQAIVVFGDDGEKFGTWPDTKKHVYDDGWLEQFFNGLVENSDWLRTTTFSESIDNVRPLDKVFLPDCSYREMTEWSLPVERQLELSNVVRSMSADPRWPQVNQFIKGGFWRNFKVRYPETNEMYSRMMQVSSRLDRAKAAHLGEQDSKAASLLALAEDELYRGQCNCSYWHGAFGGCYLPHLRNAVYSNLIRSDTALAILERWDEDQDQWIEAVSADYNFDGQPEICLNNDQLAIFVEPDRGGRLYEWDVRSIAHNLLATLSRRPEAYHQKVAAGANAHQDDCASIHDRVVFKQAGLENKLQYDPYLRKSLIDLFFDPNTDLRDFVDGTYSQRGDFRDGAYTAVIRRNPDRIQVKMTRDGVAYGYPIRITKGLTMNVGESRIEVAYLLENLPQNIPLHFGVEFNFAGLPAGCDDRYYYDDKGTKLGELGVSMISPLQQFLGMRDEWLGIDIGVIANQPTQFWTTPVQTVSNSEGGFELVHQSVCLVPNWFIQPDQDGKWSVVLTINIQTN